ncbi:AMP-binding protein [uncultured Ilumatobacter sp.]|jgi:cyclohexanecarboxylate-CoA ligase|uniref:AMP-binding protein n=1 Tax=uncultured Ilumatobacter sp. TaxID=879968 RepID=UPI00374F92B9|tara:strand:+ start:2293 stop:3912 length:1620 start_codon:yes stop_codon:yes gene_type:complete
MKSHQNRNVFLPDERIAEMTAAGAWGDKTICDFFDRWSETCPDKTAVVSINSETGRRHAMSFGELGELSERIAVDLVNRGVRLGDIVAAQLPNTCEMLAITLACARIGAVVNPLMPILRERELTHIFALTEAKVFYVPDTFKGFDFRSLANVVRNRVSTIEHVIVLGEHGFEFEDEQPAAVEHAVVNPNELFQIMFTSGTTGEPKGVMHTANTLFANVTQLADRFEVTQDDVILCPTPTAHQLGFLFGVLLPCVTGATVVFLDAWVTEKAVDLLESETVSLCMGATPFLMDISSFAGIEQRNLSSFRLFVSGGAPIPSALVSQAMEKLSAKIVSVWGMTEVLAVTTVKLDDSDDLSASTDGVALPHTAVTIVDENRRPVPSGTPGGLETRGATLCVGYLKRPALFELRDGWFDTGDLARMDDDGYIRITGRSKDIIIRGGENISVAEIEGLLFEHPRVAAVAIVAMPDPRLGERACAFVRLVDDRPLTLDEIREFLLDQGVAKTYVPERLEVIDEMPMTPTGKVQKFALRDIAQSFAAE